MNDDKQNSGFGALDNAAKKTNKDTAQNNSSDQGQKGGRSDRQKTDSGSYKNNSQSHESEAQDDLE